MDPEVPYRPFEIQGHRGCRGLMPENTLPAFLRALDEGILTLEMDVVISSDKKVVVSHDPFFHPAISTKPDGSPVTKDEFINLYELPYVEIEKYDVGRRGNPDFPEQIPLAVSKPLLSEVIQTTIQYVSFKNIKYNIEIKSLPDQYNLTQPSPEEFSDLVHATLFPEIGSKQVIIQSFDFNVLRHWHQNIASGKYESVKLSLLVEPHDNNNIDYNLKQLGFKPDIWSPEFKQVNQTIVNQLHNLSIKVIPWTVNEVQDMRNVYDLGCDGLITDYPNRARSL
jgi:glycerophosphoryl diester phosphodiesterase